MAAVSHGIRHLRQGIGFAAHAFAHRPSNRIVSETRTLFSRLVSHLLAPSHSSFAASAEQALTRTTHFSNSQSISSRFSLPVKHALSRPFSPPRLPKPPVVPANITQVGLGTARAFHSGRPIFQNMVDNVPIATRALWEAEWDVKVKKKEACRMRRTVQNKTVPKSEEMLKPNSKPVTSESQYDPSEIDVYFPVQPTPAVTTHLLVPLAPTPTGRLPLFARTDNGDAHPLIPIADLASIHTRHRLHSLRVSTLFAKLDTANVWDDPGVNVDAYAFGPHHVSQDIQEMQCTILRVTFRAWDASRVRSILGDSAEEWYSLEETHPDGHPTPLPLPSPKPDIHMNTRSQSPSLENVEVDSSCVSEVETDDGWDVLSPPPVRACASAQHDLVLPTLDFSSTFADAVGNLPSPPQPVIFLRTISELNHDAEVASQPSASSWESVCLNSSFLQHGEEHCWGEGTQNV